MIGSAITTLLAINILQLDGNTMVSLPAELDPKGKLMFAYLKSMHGLTNDRYCLADNPSSGRLFSRCHG